MTLRLRSVIVVLVVLAAGFGMAYVAALHLLKSQIVEALGPRGSVRDVGVAGFSVEITGLRIAADPKDGAWPGKDELRAERVRVLPDLLSLFSDTISVATVRIEQGYLPMMRTSKSMRIVPSLLARDRKRRDDIQPRKVHIGRIELADSEIDFFDATVSRKPHLVPLRKIEGHLDDLALPALDEAETLDFTAVIPGGGSEGTLALRGSLTPSNLDSSTQLELRGVALQVLRPYFVKAADTEVKRGTLQLDLHTRIEERRLHAPGKLILQDLELAGDDFLGLSRQAAVSLLKDDHSRIDLEFSLDGKIDDPKFSLNEEFYVRIGAALAKTLGLRFEGLGQGAGDAVKNLGGTLKKMFGDR